MRLNLSGIFAMQLVMVSGKEIFACEMMKPQQMKTQGSFNKSATICCKHMSTCSLNVAGLILIISAF